MFGSRDVHGWNSVDLEQDLSGGHKLDNFLFSISFDTKYFMIYESGSENNLLIQCARLNWSSLV